MSVKIMGMVWDCELPRNEKYVLLALADHADHEGYNIYPSVGRVAWKTGYDERMVQRIIKKLITHGVLVGDGRGKRGTNRYRIAVECLPKRPDYGEGQIARGDILPPQDVQNVTPTGGNLPPEPSSNHPIKPSFSVNAKKPSKLPKKTSIPISPAVLIHQQVTEYYQITSHWREQITLAVGDTPDSLEKWKETLIAWTGRSFFGGNVQGQLAWFKEGIPKYTGKEETLNFTIRNGRNTLIIP